MFGGDGADGANPFGAPRARAFGTSARDASASPFGASDPFGRGDASATTATTAPGGAPGAGGGTATPFGGFGGGRAGGERAGGGRRRERRVRRVRRERERESVRERDGRGGARSERWGWVGVWRRCERVRGWRGVRRERARGERESVRRARESVRDGRARGERESFRRERESFRRERESFRRERESFRRERAANGAVDAVCARRELAVRRRPIVDDRAGVRRVRGGVAELDAVAFRGEGTRTIGGGVAVRWRWVQL